MQTEATHTQNQSFFQNTIDRLNCEGLFGPRMPVTLSHYSPLDVTPTTFISATPPVQRPQAYLISSIPGLLLNDALVFSTPENPFLNTCSNPIRSPWLDGLYQPLNTAHERIDTAQRMLLPYNLLLTAISPPAAAGIAAGNFIAGIWSTLDKKADGRSYQHLKSHEYADVAAELLFKELLSSKISAAAHKIYPHPFKDTTEMIIGTLVDEIFDWKNFKQETPFYLRGMMKEFAYDDFFFLPDEKLETTPKMNKAFLDSIAGAITPCFRLIKDFMVEVVNNDLLLISQKELTDLNGANSLVNYTDSCLNQSTDIKTGAKHETTQPVLSPQRHFAENNAYHHLYSPILFEAPENSKIGVSGAIYTDKNGNIRWQISTSNPYVAAGTIGLNILIRQIHYWQLSDSDKKASDLLHRISQLNNAQADFSSRVFSFDMLKYPCRTLFDKESLIKKRQTQVKNDFIHYAQAHPENQAAQTQAKVVEFIWSRQADHERNLMNNIAENYDAMTELYRAEVNKHFSHFNKVFNQNNAKDTFVAANKLNQLAPQLPETQLALALAYEQNNNDQAAKNSHLNACRLAQNNVQDQQKITTTFIGVSYASSAEQQAMKSEAEENLRAAGGTLYSMQKNYLDFLKRQISKATNSDQKKNTLCQWKTTASQFANNHPNDPYFNSQHVQACFLSGDITEAIKHQERICQLSNEPEAHQVLYFLYHENNDIKWVDALEKYIRLNQEAPVDHHIKLAAHYINKKNWAAAEPHLKKLDQYIPYGNSQNSKDEKLAAQNQLLLCLKEQEKFDDIDAYLETEVTKPNCSDEIKEFHGKLKLNQFQQGMNKVAIYSTIFASSYSIGEWLGKKIGNSLAFYGIFGTTNKGNTETMQHDASNIPKSWNG